MAHRRLGPRSAQPRALFVESFQHLQLGELGQDGFDHRVGAQLSAVDQDHRRRASDGLGHRKDAKDGVDRRGLPRAALTRGARPEDASCVAHHADEKGDVLVGDGLADDSVEIGHRCLRKERCAAKSTASPDGKR